MRKGMYTLVKTPVLLCKSWVRVGQNYIYRYVDMMRCPLSEQGLGYGEYA